MLRNAVAVIDCGSSKITGLIGENGVNNNFAIRAYAQQVCYALYSGSVDDPDSFRSALKKVFDTISSSARAKITEIYFSVPSDFLKVVNAKSQIYFNNKKRLKTRDIDEFLSDAKKNISVSGYELIDYSGIQYFLDGEKKVTSLLNEVTSTISGLTSFFYAKSSFIRLVTEFLSSLGVKVVHFVPVALAESVLLFPDSERYTFEVLLDVGASVTDFSIVYGGGILYNESFDIGGGFINGYLMQEFGIDSYDFAEKLKRKFNLTISSQNGNFYEVSRNDKILTFPRAECNKIVEQFLIDLAERIDNAIKNSNVRLPEAYNLSITGGGIAYIRGAKEYLFRVVEIPINIVCPKISYMAKPEETSKIAVLNYALNGKYKRN